MGTDPLTGKRIKVKRSKNKKEAQLALSRLQLDIEKNGYNKKACDTYLDVYNIWIKQYKNTVKESTFVKTEGIFRNHILPALGQYKIEKIKILDCQEHVNVWFTKLKNFRMVCTYASKVFDYAITIGEIEKNPMKLVSMPVNLAGPEAGEDENKNFYTKEQLIEFLECIQKENNFKGYVFFRVLVFSGLRKGEALALTWKDIDFKNSTINVNKALARGEDARLLIQAPKTKNSTRTLIMDVKTMNLLKEWRKVQKANLKKLGYNEDLKGKQLVFNNEKNEFIQPSKTTRWLDNVQKKYELEKITTHGFRHYGEFYKMVSDLKIG